MNAKSFIVGATVATSAALLVAELIRDQIEARRETTQTLAHEISKFAHKESMGDALRKRTHPAD